MPNLSRPALNDRDSVFNLRDRTYPEHQRTFQRMLLPIEKSAQRRKRSIGLRTHERETSYTEISNAIVFVIQCTLEHRNKLYRERLIWSSMSNRIAYRKRGISRIAGFPWLTEAGYIPPQLPGKRRLFRPRDGRTQQGNSYRPSSKAIRRIHRHTLSLRQETQFLRLETICQPHRS